MEEDNIYLSNDIGKAIEQKKVNNITGNIRETGLENDLNNFINEQEKLFIEKQKLIEKLRKDVRYVVVKDRREIVDLKFTVTWAVFVLFIVIIFLTLLMLDAKVI